MANKEAHNNKLSMDKFLEIYESGLKLRELQSKIKEKFDVSLDISSIHYRVKKAKAAGLIEVDKDNMVNAGEVYRGRTTTFYERDEDGKVEKIHHLKVDAEKSNLLADLQQGAQEFYEQFTSRYTPIETPENTKDDLLTFYPLPDMHWGLLTHGEELQHGENFNLKIQEQWVLGAMRHLVDTAVPTKKCIITDLGDVLHSMDDKNQTKSGHHLDVDGRTHKIVKVMFSAFTKLVDMALTKHEIVEVYSVAGNHSDLAGLYLKAHLAAWYRNEPRVVIVESEKSQQYAQFGKCILGFTHGHELKPQRAGEVLVADNMDIISETEHRYFHFGHFHHNQKDSTYPLCEVEIHNNNLPQDKWADSMGYRGNKVGEAKSITYHKEYGEISRNRFNINMLDRKE